MSSKPPHDWPVITYDSLDSTSEEARRQVLVGIREPPFVIQATHQTQGRGRGTNRWWSDEGSLLFTLVLDPLPMGIEPRHEPRLALISALAIIDALPGLGARIRWPNDVEIAGRKLAGILPERIDSDQGSRLCIGIGVNVSTRFETAPAEVRRLATSVLELAPTSSPDPRLIDRILYHFDKNRQLLIVDNSELSERCNALNTLAGQSVRVQMGENCLTGIAQDINSEGGLVIATVEGPMTVYGGQVLRD